MYHQNKDLDLLTDFELITAFLGQDTAEIANELYAAYGNVNALNRAHPAELENQLGAATAYRLAAALELGRRVQSRRETLQVIRQAADVFSVCGPQLSHLTHETFGVLCLDAKNQLRRFVRVTEGGLAACSVLPREAFAPVLTAAAPAAIFVHNHPSGDPTPSDEDIALTRRLYQAGEVLGIKVLDHVIIGEGRFESLAERCLGGRNVLRPIRHR